MSGSVEVSYAERDREFIAARTALAEAGAAYVEAMTRDPHGWVPPHLLLALSDGTRRYRAAERGLRKAAKRRAPCICGARGKHCPWPISCGRGNEAPDTSSDPLPPAGARAHSGRSVQTGASGGPNHE